MKPDPTKQRLRDLKALRVRITAQIDAIEEQLAAHDKAVYNVRHRQGITGRRGKP